MAREAFPVVVCAVCVVQLLRYLSVELGQDGWLALLAGREVAHGGLPHHNDLTMWAQGGRWIDQPWLAQLGMYGLYVAGGVKLLLLVNAALIAGAFALAVAAARLVGASPVRTAAVAGLSIPVVASYWQVRTQSFAYVLFVLVLLLLVADCRSPSRRVLLVLPLLVLWANVHGSVVLGGALVVLRGLTLAAGAIRSGGSYRASLGRPAVLSLAPVICIFCSPYGFGLAGYYRETIFNPGLTRYISEWHTTRPSLSTAPFFVLLFGTAFLIGRARSLTIFERFAVLGTGVAGVAALRNTVWFGLAAIVILPVALQEVWPERPSLPRTGFNLRASFAAIAVALAAVITVSARPLSWVDREWSPGGLAVVSRVLDEQPPPRVFSTMRFADWLLLREPRLAGRLAFDARVELLSRSDLRRFYDFTNQSGADRRDAAAGYDLIVLDSSRDRATAHAFLADPGVRRLYGDDSITILARRS